MRFAHFADCHIGGWRDPKMRDANARAFSKAVEMSIQANVDFILLSGDLFNTALPAIEGLKEVVVRLAELRDKGIRVYAIAGSHDYSPSGKTMLDVLEHAGLLVNVLKGSVVNDALQLKFTVDKTGAMITGMHGRKGLLERNYYNSLDTSNLDVDGFKIFMFHTAISELNSNEQMETTPLSLLPKGFAYYAGGHVHEVISVNEPGYGLINYPGPLFPNTFKELEELHNGGFYIVEETNGEVKAEWNPIVIFNVLPIRISCRGKSAADVDIEMLSKIKDIELNNTLVTVRVWGCLKSGKVTDINFRDVFAKMYEKSAYFIMKNTSAMSSKEFEEIKVRPEPVEQTEISIIREQLAANKQELEIADQGFVHSLMNLLNKEKDEGENQSDFEDRIKAELSKKIQLQ